MNINSRIKLLSKLGRFFSAYLKKNNNEFDKRLFNFTDKKVQEAIYQNSFFEISNPNPNLNLILNKRKSLVIS